MNHTGLQKQQTKGQQINTPRQIYWSKNRDFETASSKNRDSETRTTAENTRLQDPRKSAKILQDPNFLKDHSPPLTVALLFQSSVCYGCIAGVSDTKFSSS